MTGLSMNTNLSGVCSTSHLLVVRIGDSSLKEHKRHRKISGDETDITGDPLEGYDFP